MLQIIEDLQRQHEQQQEERQKTTSSTLTSNNCVPPRPVRRAPLLQPAAPPTVVRSSKIAPLVTTPLRQQTMLPQRTTVDNSPKDDLLAGADYHLYEEIISDVCTDSSGAGADRSVVVIGVQQDKQQPPPLPARPSALHMHNNNSSKCCCRRPVSGGGGGVVGVVSAPDAKSVNLVELTHKPWANVVKPFVRNRNSAAAGVWCCSTDVSHRPNVRANLYTFAAHRHAAAAAAAAARNNGGVGDKKESLDDEYGFRTHVLV